MTEVAGATGLSKAAVGRILDQLTQIAYREAERGFVIPGICKLKVVKKKASRHRNPVTGRLLLIGERLAVKIVPLKKAKSIITPNRDVTVQVIDDLTLLDLNAPAAASVPQPPAQPPESPPVSNAPVPAVPPSGTVIPESEEGQIVFPCPECGSMIAAPPKAAGQKGDCPFCKANLVVPQRHLETRPDKQVLSEQTAPSGAGATDFVAFVCRACGQEIEAPVDMVGMSVECPTCGSGLKVPIANAPKVPPAKTTPTAAKSKADMSSMTIRIDLSDLQ